jgi:hypothetical protein
VKKPGIVDEDIIVSMVDVYEFEEEIEFCEGYIPD